MLINLDDFCYLKMLERLGDLIQNGTNWRILPCKTRFVFVFFFVFSILKLVIFMHFTQSSPITDSLCRHAILHAIYKQGT